SPAPPPLTDLHGAPAPGHRLPSHPPDSAAAPPAAPAAPPDDSASPHLAPPAALRPRRQKFPASIPAALPTGPAPDYPRLLRSAPHSRAAAPPDTDSAPARIAAASHHRLHSAPPRP